MPPPAFLLVFSDPGTGVPEDEFHDWYDNEHIPLRVRVPAFLNWTRWDAVDGEKPRWAASYDLTSYEDTLSPPYSTLAETRSERERGILQTLDILERRTYELQEGTSPPSALFDGKTASPFVVFLSFNVQPGAEEASERWFGDEYVPRLAGLSGWVRSRRFVLKDWQRLGRQGAGDVSPPPRYVVMHEWTVLEDAGRDVVRTPFPSFVEGVQLRIVKRYKVWER